MFMSLVISEKENYSKTRRPQGKVEEICESHLSCSSFFSITLINQLYVNLMDLTVFDKFVFTQDTEEEDDNDDDEDEDDDEREKASSEADSSSEEDEDDEDDGDVSELYF